MKVETETVSWVALQHKVRAGVHNQTFPILGGKLVIYEEETGGKVKIG